MPTPNEKLAISAHNLFDGLSRLVRYVGQVIADNQGAALLLVAFGISFGLINGLVVKDFIVVPGTACAAPSDLCTALTLETNDSEVVCNDLDAFGDEVGTSCTFEAIYSLIFPVILLFGLLFGIFMSGFCHPARKDGTRRRAPVGLMAPSKAFGFSFVNSFGNAALLAFLFIVTLKQWFVKDIVSTNAAISGSKCECWTNAERNLNIAAIVFGILGAVVSMVRLANNIVLKRKEQRKAAEEQELLASISSGELVDHDRIKVDPVLAGRIIGLSAAIYQVLRTKIRRVSDFSTAVAVSHAAFEGVLALSRTRASHEDQWQAFRRETLALLATNDFQLVKDHDTPVESEAIILALGGVLGQALPDAVNPASAASSIAYAVMGDELLPPTSDPNVQDFQRMLVLQLALEWRLLDPSDKARDDFMVDCFGVTLSVLNDRFHRFGTNGVPVDSQVVRRTESRHSAVPAEGSGAAAEVDVVDDDGDVDEHDSAETPVLR